MLELFNVQFPGLGINESNPITVDRVAFRILGWPIQWYGILIAMAFVLAIVYAARNAKKFALDRDKMLDVALAAVFAGIVGARLYYVIFSGNSEYLTQPWKILYVWEGGLAFYGAAIGGAVAAIIASRWRKINVLAMMDMSVICLLIGQAIGRWGNFVNQEAYGGETTLPWRMVSEGTKGLAVHPCFLYESLWCIIGVLVLHIFARKFRRYDGQVTLLYAVWYGTGRFFIEGLRTDSLMLWGMRVSQVFAALSVVVAIVLLIVFRKNTKLDGVGYGRTFPLAEPDAELETDQDIELDTEVETDQDVTKEEGSSQIEDEQEIETDGETD